VWKLFEITWSCWCAVHHFDSVDRTWHWIIDIWWYDALFLWVHCTVFHSDRAGLCWYVILCIVLTMFLLCHLNLIWYCHVHPRCLIVSDAWGNNYKTAAILLLDLSLLWVAQLCVLWCNFLALFRIMSWKINITCVLLLTNLEIGWLTSGHVLTVFTIFHTLQENVIPLNTVITFFMKDFYYNCITWRAIWFVFIICL